MKLSQEIIQAMKEAVNEIGSQVEFGEKVGNSPQNIHRYLTGKVSKIETETWIKMEPYLREYLPVTFYQNMNSCKTLTLDSSMDSSTISLWDSVLFDSDMPDDMKIIMLKKIRETIFKNSIPFFITKKKNN